MSNTFTPNQGCVTFAQQFSSELDAVDEILGDKICIAGKNCNLYGCIELESNEVPTADGQSSFFITTCTLSIGKCHCPHCHPVCGDVIISGGKKYRVKSHPRLSEDGCDKVWDIAETEESCLPCLGK